MTQHSVEKIGGTSMLDSQALIDNVLIGGREEPDCYQRIFVVSAYAGITNQLLEHKKTGMAGVYGLFVGAESDWAWGDALSETAVAMQQRNAEIFGDTPARRDADLFVRERIEGVRSCLVDLQRLCSYGHFDMESHLNTVRELLASIGEAHSAFNTALLLQQRSINARFIDLTGWRDETQMTLDERIEQALEGIDVSREMPIVTGYTRCRHGMMNEFDRGYSEVTFSRLAVLSRAKEAIIHKEFHLSSADPALVGVDVVKTIGRTNYDVADQLANMGMEAIHPRAAQGLRQASIPLRVKNTFEPEADGTTICSQYVSQTPRTEIITGLRQVHALEFFEQDMVGVKGYDAAILEALKRHSVRIVTKTSNANTIVHYLAGSAKAIKRVVRDLTASFDSATIRTRKVAIVSAIGSDMSVPGITARAVGALAEAGIELLGIHQGMRNVDILFILESEDFEPAIKTLHEALIECDATAQRVNETSPAPRKHAA